MRYRSALVTGAGGRLGAAMVRTLAEQGARVHLLGQNAGRLEPLARSIVDHGGWARAYPEPSQDATRRLQLVRAIDEEAGGLDLVVANLHDAERLPPPSHGPEEAAFVPRLTVATLTAVLPRMLARHRGQLASVIPLTERRDVQHAARYAFAVVMGQYLRSLREQLRGSGVLVNEARIGPLRGSSPGGLARTSPLTVDAREAAQAAVHAMRQGSPVLTFPWHAVATAKASRLLSSLGRAVG